jgi:aspartyl-tRNA(Asn)/glutamyl-tRNA(Gln) amidotransferase subunit A
MNQYQPAGILGRSAVDHLKALEQGEYTAEELARQALAHAESTASLNIFLSLDPERIIQQARESDARRRAGKAGVLEGIPVSIKDNICEENERVTCASKFLENYRSPYSATVIQKLKEAGAVLFGRTNLDEFAMGSSTENSAFGVTRNPHDPQRVPGGSSGGSAASVAAGVVPLSLGSDTGGSIRQPAAFCGIYGLKPTYGRVSRYGLVAFASSLDQIGPFARTADDTALLMSVLNGHDPADSTSHPMSDARPVARSPEPFTSAEWKKLRIGIQIPDAGEEGFDADVVKACEKMADELRSSGATIVPVKSRLWEYSIPIYYILATAEASSNLARFDGIRYGRRAKGAKNLIDLYVRSRTEGFGPEVKRRILLGTYVLSSGYYDAYYSKAEKARRMIREEYRQFFSEVDLIVQPTSPTTAFRIGEKSGNPIAMYRSDMLTIAVNLGGVPSLNIPFGEDAAGLPIGMQVTGKHFEEDLILRFAKSLEVR